MDVIDSHTAGESTRVVMAGGPDLGAGPLGQRLDIFRESFDAFRSTVVNEPRGSDAMVGALLCTPFVPDCAAGVIFFNNVGCLGMCGHGTMGLAVTLAHAGLIRAGTHRFDTPVGVVTATLHDANTVTVSNVQSYRTQAGVGIDVEGVGRVVGDVAWGGNWFFLTSDHRQHVHRSNIAALSDTARRVRQALAAAGVRGAGGAEIDHIELFGPPTVPGADAKNFVLCPGLAYDRSPCGTGSSAKVACLIADGKLRPGQPWRQEGILGGCFDLTAHVEQNRIFPSIRGQAFLTAQATLIISPLDPFRHGIRH